MRHGLSRYLVAGRSGFITKWRSRYCTKEAVGDFGSGVMRNGDDTGDTQLDTDYGATLGIHLLNI
jgi:hypothetical protein